MQRYIFPIVLAIVALAIIFGGAVVGLYTDWLWFSDLGFGTVFGTMLLTKVKIGLLLGGLFFAIIYSNLWYARRIAPPPSPTGIEQQLLERLGHLARRAIGLALFLGSVVISAMVGLEAATHWEEWLKYFNATPFQLTDPIFNMDIGFYVFKLPFLQYIYHWLFFALVASTIATVALHYADEAIETFGGRLQFAPKAKTHIAFLLAMMFFLKAWGYRLSMYALVSVPGKLFDGGGYTDIQARLPMLWVMFVVAIIGGILVLLNINRRGISFAAAGFILVVGASVIVGSAYPATVQQFTVKPNELVKETPYIEKAIKATRAAYGLTEIEPVPFKAETTLTAKQIVADRATTENIRLWDKEHLLAAINQIQTILQFCTFEDVDVDRYWLDTPGSDEKRYRQVWLSARGMDQDELPAQSQTWINKHLQYTHGYGYIMCPISEALPNGRPVFYVKDIPPITTVDLPTKRMGVYFGEMTDEYVFVRTSAEEFDYTSGREEEPAAYEASAGVGIGSFFRKLLFALKFSDVSIMLNENLTPESRILYQREVDDRVRTLLPFLDFDDDPYLVTVNGDLYWMRDAYTMTDAYPYSQHVSGRGTSFNYIRNSVKLVVDAYTGNVSAYVIQEPLEDPIIKTYQKMFPGVFKPISEMPEELRAHIRYPQDLFQIQTVIYRNYHMSQPREFYNKSDLWDIARRAELTSAEEEPPRMEPYYVIMKLPDGEKEEFLLMMPYKRGGKKTNIVAWMCAKCDAPDYGELVLYEFPEGVNVPGPQQIAAKARANDEISAQITLWSQQGSEVGSGNLLVIPIDDSLLYVMPVYLVSTTTKIPEVRRVIVVLGDKIAMEKTLNEALAKVVGAPVKPIPTAYAPTPAKKPKPGDIPSVPTTEVTDVSTRLIDKAVSQIESAERAQRKGDWAEYGKQVEALKRTLKKLQSE